MDTDLERKTIVQIADLINLPGLDESQRVGILLGLACQFALRMKLGNQEHARQLISDGATRYFNK